MPDILIDIPPRVLGRVQHALASLHAWNAVLEDVRRAETIARQAGRYEYLLRYGQEGAVHRRCLEAAEETLEQFEGLAHANGVDPEAVYAACGGKPALLEQGAQVQEWRPSH